MVVTVEVLILEQAVMVVLVDLLRPQRERHQLVLVEVAVVIEHLGSLQHLRYYLILEVHL